MTQGAPLTLPMRRRPRGAVPGLPRLTPLLRPDPKHRDRGDDDDDDEDKDKRREDTGPVQRKSDRASITFTFPASDWAGPDGRKTMVINDLQELTNRVGYKNCFMLTTNGMESAEKITGLKDGLQDALCPPSAPSPLPQPEV